MPEMDGLEATALIRINERDSQKPVRCNIIGMSANGDSMMRERAISAGMDEFLVKPFKIDEVIEIYYALHSAVFNV